MSMTLLNDVERLCRPLESNGHNGISVNGNRLCEPGICLNPVAVARSGHRSQIAQW